MQIQIPMERICLPPIRTTLRTIDQNKMLRRLETLIKGFRDVRDNFQFRQGCFFGGWDAHRGEPGFVSGRDLAAILIEAGFVQLPSERFSSLFDLMDGEDGLSASCSCNTWLLDNEVVTIRSEVADRGKHVTNRLLFSVLDPVLKAEFLGELLG